MHAQPLLWLIAYLMVGAVVGTFAGMLGVGGGLVIIPLLAIALEAQGFPHAHVLHVAVGTAMATIMFTSLSSTRAHAAKRAVRWDMVRTMTPGILLGSLIGASLARYMSTRMLAVVFAVFVIWLAANMVLNVQPKIARNPPGSIALFFAGFSISGLCSLSAMGGAVMTVPFMLRYSVPMVDAIGTAAALGFPIAVGGTIGYVLSGWGALTLPPWSFGYVYLPALAAISIASVLAAPIGARIAHRLPQRVLRLMFSLLLLVLAGRMLVSLW